MSAHPLGSATLSFGLVSVPIKMFSTGESSAAISFNWLHKKDGARLKQQYVCSKDGDKVEKDEMVKGYEFTKGQYVIFKPEELKALEEDRKSTRLNSSHSQISYAVFCLKKKKNNNSNDSLYT